MNSPPLPTFVEFAHPEFFCLLACLPLFVWIGLASMSALSATRRKVAITLRCLLFTVLALALAEPHWVRTTDDQTVVFALDQSDSIPNGLQEDALRYIKQATETMRPGKDRVAGLVFAGQPSIWQTGSDQLVMDRLPPVQQRDSTNIASAMRISLGVFPPETAKRLVLVTDGNECQGLAATMAESYSALNIPVDILPLRYHHRKEVLVDRLVAPVKANRDETIELQLFVRSTQATPAKLILHHNDKIVDLDADSDEYAASLFIENGANRFNLPVQLATSGVHRFRAVIQPEFKQHDATASNNEGQAFTLVGDAERVVIVAGDADTPGAGGIQQLAEALTAGGIEIEQLPVRELPNDPAFLADCSTLILSNVSAFLLSNDTQRMIASFVRDHGGGLIAIGGDRAFSVGAYAHTPLEKVLPVETDRDKLKLLSLGMVIVIDRSGSMRGEKLSLARLAANAAIEKLGPLDRIGIVAFDSTAQWVVPLQYAEHKSVMAKQVSSITSGGGTNMHPALERAHKALAVLDTNLKHIILLTDGRSTPGDFTDLAQKCRDASITISTIAVGSHADRPLLARIAKISNGRPYVIDRAAPLPQILIHETVLASRSGLREKTITPKLVPTVDDPILGTLTQADLPPLGGYVVTATKPTATAPLIHPTEDADDPILACWRIGLGRSVAFTSGMWERWGYHWVVWPGFSRFWTQVIRYTGRPANPSDLDVETNIVNGRGRVIVSAEHLATFEQASLGAVARLIRPDFSVESVHLRQTELGRLEGEFVANEPGTYLANVAYQLDTATGDQSGTVRSGAVVAYSQEYAAVKDNETALLEIARKTGGRMLYRKHPETVFEPSSIRPVRVRRSMWDLLVIAALPMFLLDVAIRRLAISPLNIYEKCVSWIDSLVANSAGTRSVATLATLKQTQTSLREGEKRNPEESTPDNQTSAIPSMSKYRSREAMQAEDQTRIPMAQTTTPSASQPQPQDAATGNETDAPQQKNKHKPQASTQLRPEPETENGASPNKDEGHTSRLLRRKRKLRDEKNDNHNA